MTTVTAASSSVPTADFERELAAVADSRAPISASRIQQVTKAAFRQAKHYKAIVHGIERFIQRSGPDHKLTGLYLIDSIARGATKTLSDSESRPLVLRFEEKLESMVPYMLGASAKDKAALVQRAVVYKRSASQSPFEPAAPVKVISSGMDPRMRQAMSETALPAAPSPVPVTEPVPAVQPGLDAVSLLNTIASLTSVSGGLAPNLAGLLPLLGATPGVEALLSGAVGVLPTAPAPPVSQPPDSSTGDTGSLDLSALGIGVNPLASLMLGLSGGGATGMMAGASAHIPSAVGGEQKVSHPGQQTASGRDPREKAVEFDYDDDDDLLVRKPVSVETVPLDQLA
ncbi:Protein NRD1 [Cladochytrium tenue]|nr:Protein NRD1 [Cladochytrium tenue]